MPRAPLTLSLVLLGLFGTPGPATADTYFVPPGVEDYVLSLSRSPKIQACGWEASGITAGPRTIRYAFGQPETGAEATVTLAHPSTCLEVVAGPGGAFCLSHTSSGARPATGCGPAALAEEIAGAIRVSEASLRWVRPVSRPPDQLPLPGSEAAGEPPRAPGPEDPTGDFSLYLLALTAFVAVRLRGWRLWREGLLHLGRWERRGLIAIPLAGAALALFVYGSGELPMWVGEQVFSAGGLLRMAPDPATEVALGRALLFRSVAPEARLFLALLLGALCLLQAFALARRAGCSPRLALVLVAFLALSPLHGRFSTAEPVFLLALALGLATVHAALAWLAGPTPERLWALGTAYLAGAWLVVGPGSLLGLPLLLLLHPLGERPGQRRGRLLTLAALLGLTLLLGLRTARSFALPAELAGAEHQTALGILLHYHLAHPILALLALLGLGSLPRRRGPELLLALLGLGAAGVFGLGGALAGWSSLSVFTFLALPLLLLSGAGLKRAAGWLPPDRPAQRLVLAAALLLVLHHTLLFHGLFGRLLFS